MPPDNPKPKKRLTREEQANLEIGNTTVSPRLAWITIGVFLAIIIAVPLIDAARSLAAGKPLQALSLFSAVNRSELAVAYRRGTPVDEQLSVTERATRVPGVSLPGRVLAANKQALKQFDGYETDQKDDSFLAAAIQPVQALTTRFTGKGNSLGIVGADPTWLFFKPGIDSLTGAPFLDPDQLQRRAESHATWDAPAQPDPLLALADLHAALAARDIPLIIVPTPVKPQIHPEKLSSRYAADAPLIHNPSWSEFTDEVAELGIHLIDAPALLHAAKLESGEPQYLATDTHWTPAGMATVADAITAKVTELTELRPASRRLFSRYKDAVSQIGDIGANTLDLRDSGIYAPQTVTVQRVETDTAEDVPLDDPDASVVLLGDSFSNIFSSDAAQLWGDSAGLPETLAHNFQQPVIALRENDNGAHASRRKLYDRIIHDAINGTDFLAGKKAVIYQFAARELAVGDWKRFDWSAVPEVQNVTNAAPVAATTITGTIDRLSRPPKPGSTPYKNCLVQVLLTDVEGLGDAELCIVYLHGMIDNKWTSAASLKAGSKVTLPVEDWTAAKRERKLDGLRIEPLDLSTELRLKRPPVLWAEKVDR